MKILVVVNNLYSNGNGVSVSASRAVQYLKEAGADVRVLSCKNPAKDGPAPDYALPRLHNPISDFFKKKSGFYPAAINNAVIREAVRWADVVQLEEPFGLQKRVCEIAEEEGKPVTASYNIHPENITAYVKMHGNALVNALLFRNWKKNVYDRCAAVRCPNEETKEFLEKKGIKAKLFVIPNGCPPADAPFELPFEKKQSLFYIVSSGRLSVEKDQVTLLKAMQYSKHHARIKLVFAGKGPCLGALKDTAEALRRSGAVMREPLFGFFTPEQLKGLYSLADLYVHCAFVEVEGLACMEAISNGVVPVIAKGKKTAASRLAVAEHGTFPAHSAKELAECIDYWIEHEDERKALSEKLKADFKPQDCKQTAEEMIALFRYVI
ncbi:MAG: glycosyltransferase [Lachnospiraceae bacterium]|nr:glycosyltransferase [Lachnospiraceae bacterium]